MTRPRIKRAGILLPSRPKRRHNDCLAWWSAADLTARLGYLRELGAAFEQRHQAVPRGLARAIDDAVTEQARRVRQTPRPRGEQSCAERRAPAAFAAR